MQGDVRFAVLGPVRAWRDEAELGLGNLITGVTREEAAYTAAHGR